MFLDVLITLSCCGVGLVCGWVSHAFTGALQQPQIARRKSVSRPMRRNASADAQVAGTGTIGDDDSSDAERGMPGDVVLDTAQQIAAVAQSLAADVDAHQSKVEEFNDQVADDLNAEAAVGQNSHHRVMQAVEQLTRANSLMRDQLRAAQDHIREQSEKLETAEREARTDALTQIANRGVFDQRADSIVNEYPRPDHVDDQTPVAVMALLDVDRFKIFNDTHGHAAGDQVLKVVASCLHEQLGQHGTVTRYGGEEFAVLLNPMPMSQALELVEAARQQLTTRPIVVDGELLTVTASAGIAALPSSKDLVADSNDEEGTTDVKSAWLRSTDDALYRSKEGGRNCAHYVDGGSIVRVKVDNPLTVDEGSDKVDDATSLNESTPGVSNETRPSETSDGTVDALDSSTASQTDSVVGDSTEQAVTQSVEKIEDLVAQVDSDSTSEAVSGGSEEAFQACLALVSSNDVAPPPATLRYLPDRETLIELLEELPPSRSDTSTTHLLTLRLGGTPSGATLRSVLQLLRAGGGAQDRIGCLDQNNLIVAIPDSKAEAVMERAEQLCHAATGLGVPLCDPEGPNQEEQISVGISPCRPEEARSDEGSEEASTLPVDWDHLISRSIAAAMMAESQRMENSDLPICFYNQASAAAAS